MAKEKRLKFTTIITVEKYESREQYEKKRPYQVVTKKGNIMLATGMNEMWRLIAGMSADHFDSTYATIGVGDSAVAPSEDQTDLLGANKEYKGMDPGMPVVNEKMLYTQATFYETEANFTWNEIVLKNSQSGKCLNRSVYSFGTKQEGNIWPVTVRIMLSN